MYKCCICGKECDSNIKLVNHLRSHNIRSKEDLKRYYDEYIKLDNEGICMLDGCNNNTKFRNLKSGYSRCCCLSHCTKLQMSEHNHMIGVQFSQERRNNISKSLMGKKWSNERKIKYNLDLQNNPIKMEEYREYIKKGRELYQQKRKNTKRTKHDENIIQDALKGDFERINNDVLTKCVFCGFESNRNNGVSYHVYLKHFLRFDSYKNLFYYKRKSFNNYCPICKKKIPSTSIVCGEHLSYVRKITWENRSVDEKNRIVNSLLVGRRNTLCLPHTEETKRKISEHSQYKNPQLSAKLKEYQSNLVTRRILEGEWNPHSNYKNGYLDINKFGGRIFFRSSIEKKILECLSTNKNILKGIYEPFRCFYTVIESGISYNRYTIPDLFLNFLDHKKRIVEIKPFEFIEDPNDCWDKFLIQKLTGILDYSKTRGFNNPWVFSFKNNRVVYIQIEYYLNLVKEGEYDKIKLTEL